jgi:hypothetical protein
MTMMLGNLLAFGFLPEHELVTSVDPEDRPVRAVVAVRTSDEADRLEPDQFAVLDHVRFAASQAGLASVISRAADRGSAGLLAYGSADQLPGAVRTLAEVSDVPLVLTERYGDARGLVAAMDRFVRTPDQPDAAVISRVSHRLRSTGSDLAGMVRATSTALRCPVVLLDVEGRQVAGNVPAAVVRSSSFQRACGSTATRPGQQVRALDDALLVVQPIRFTEGSPLNLRLVAMVPMARVAFARTASVSLSVAAWAFAAHLATVAIRLERQGGARAALLARLLDEADAPSPYVLEQAAAAGWRLGGTHTAVALRPTGDRPADPVAQYRLREVLGTRGLAADPIPDGDGWVLWLTDLGPRDDDALPHTVRGVLLDVEKACPGVGLCAGIGASGTGTTGLRDSMHDAHRACAMAAAGGGAHAVERLGANHAKRLLSDRHVSPSQVDIAEQLLRPLTSVDMTGQLTHTLSCYLDNESSATATALALGVHRNTVLQRLDRIRAVLRIDLTDPGDRLALHLATRLVPGPTRE